MGEELQLKIAENAKLHAALHGVDKRYLTFIEVTFRIFLGTFVRPKYLTFLFALNILNKGMKT